MEDKDDRALRNWFETEIRPALTQSENPCPSCAALRRELAAANERAEKAERHLALANESLAGLHRRAIFCYFCGHSWPHEGHNPPEKLLREALQHEATCEKNPYRTRIAELERERDEAQGALCRAREANLVLNVPDWDIENRQAQNRLAIALSSSAPCPHAEREKVLEEAEKAGYYLSTYAAAINWDGSPNTRDWLDGLREAIMAVQNKYEERRRASGVTP